MSDYIGVPTNKGLVKIAASLGGAALNLTTVRVGDGNGAPITPNPAMTDLVRRVGAAYPIVSSGRDPVNLNYWRVSALIPVEDGPFDIREIGVWDVAGDMIAVGRHVLVEKRTPSQGAAVEVVTDIVFPVAETAQITVAVTPDAAVSIMALLRMGFTVVESMTTTSPPANPALGRTHIVPADPTGAWAGLAGQLVQWNGIVWVSANMPEGFIVVVQDKPVDSVDRWQRRTAAGWTSALAGTDRVGPTRLATASETGAGVSGLAVSPDNLSATLAKLPIHAEVKTADGRFTVAAAGGNVVVTGVTIVWRGFRDFDLTGLAVGSRTFATIASQTYHLRWYAPGIGRATPSANWPLGRLYLESLGDAAYNPTALAETNVAFDSTFDSILIARVDTNGANVATVATLANKTRLAVDYDVAGPGYVTTTGSPLDGAAYTNSCTHLWGRVPQIMVIYGYAATSGAGFPHGAQNEITTISQSRYGTVALVTSDYQADMTGQPIVGKLSFKGTA